MRQSRGSLTWLTCSTCVARRLKYVGLLVEKRILARMLCQVRSRKPGSYRLVWKHRPAPPEAPELLG
jgi:hypothetical protein